jgi:hypothetical protein
VFHVHARPRNSSISRCGGAERPEERRQTRRGEWARSAPSAVAPAAGAGAHRERLVSFGANPNRFASEARGDSAPRVAFRSARGVGRVKGSGGFLVRLPAGEAKIVRTSTARRAGRRESIPSPRRAGRGEGGVAPVAGIDPSKTSARTIRCMRKQSETFADATNQWTKEPRTRTRHATSRSKAGDIGDRAKRRTVLAKIVPSVPGNAPRHSSAARHTCPAAEHHRSRSSRARNVNRPLVRADVRSLRAPRARTPVESGCFVELSRRQLTVIGPIENASV